MTQLEAALLGAVQGVAELLPISSSAHLYVIPSILGRPYAGPAFDVTLHAGTFVALLAAFWRDWLELARNAFAADRAARAAARTIWARLAVASAPAAVAGYLLQDAAAGWLRSLPLQASMLLVFGFLLWWIDRARPATRHERVPGWGTCLFVGAAQTLALVPGVSRSGVTMTAARLAGLTRVDSARFSFLLATPITLGACLVESHHAASRLPVGTLLAGMLSAAVVGLLAIGVLLRWLGRTGFAPFFAYRAVLAAFIFFHWLGRQSGLGSV
jgi:undecaprenyl-diphosphatase